MGSVLASLAAIVAVAAHAQSAPPNLVAIDAKIVTSGQPSAAWLARLEAEGYEAVVYLAPATVPDAVRDEPLIVSRQGIVYVNLPIRFDGPTERDFDAFAGVMQGLRDRKVLVHCQVNLRASSMTFLYRAIVRREDPAKAYEAVAAVWSPHDAWMPYLRSMLARHGIAFEPY